MNRDKVGKITGYFIDIKSVKVPQALYISVRYISNNLIVSNGGIRFMINHSINNSITKLIKAK